MNRKRERVAEGAEQAVAEAEWVAIEVERAAAQAVVTQVARAQKAAQAGDKAAAKWLREWLSSRQASAVPAASAPAKSTLDAKARRFAEVWAGDSTKAAREAGYKGSANALASRGSRLLDHPEVRAIIEARGGTIPAKAETGKRLKKKGAAPEEPAAAPAEILDPLEVLQRIANDPSARPSARTDAAAKLQRFKNAEAERRAAEGGDVLERLRKKVREILAKKRARARV